MNEANCPTPSFENSTIERTTHLKQIEERIIRNEKERNDLLKAKEILENNPDLRDLLDITRRIGIY